MEVKDFTGKEIFVGDRVACIAKGYRMLVEAVVVSISSKTLLLEYNNTWNYGAFGKMQKYRANHNDVIKIG